MIDLCWTLAVALFAATTVIAPLTFIALLEPGRSPVEIFALRGRSLRYVTIWTVFAIAAIVLAGFNGLVECVEVASVVLAAFIPVYSWRVYFENHDFVEQFVQENKERTARLLFDGMGIDEQTFEAVCSAIETAQVEFFRNRLSKKRWTELNDTEIGELMFTSGIETAKVIAEKLSKDMHWTVFAFMHEWKTYVERIRIPMRAKKELEKQSTEKQFLNCIAIILANETRDVREIRDRSSDEVHLPYHPIAGVIARQTAVEGILSWPDCLQKMAEIRIRHVEFNPVDLYLLPEKQHCCGNDIPFCVKSTLREMLKGGFLHLPLNGKKTVPVSFQSSYAVFERKDWDDRRAINLKPFKYVTAVTCQNGDPAFVIEPRERIDQEYVWKGSRAIEGILHVEVDLEVREEESWLHDADFRNDEAGIWGVLDHFVTPLHRCWPQRLVLATIRAVYSVSSLLKRTSEHLRIKEDISSSSSNV